MQIKVFDAKQKQSAFSQNFVAQVYGNFFLKKRVEKFVNHISCPWTLFFEQVSWAEVLLWKTSKIHRWLAQFLSNCSFDNWWFWNLAWARPKPPPHFFVNGCIWGRCWQVHNWVSICHQCQEADYLHWWPPCVWMEVGQAWSPFSKTSIHKRYFLVLRLGLVVLLTCCCLGLTTPKIRCSFKNWPDSTTPCPTTSILEMLMPMLLGKQT